MTWFYTAPGEALGPSAGRQGAAPPVGSLSDGVVREVLPNGVTLLLKSVASSPAVAISTCFKVGYFQEQDHESGLAHLMEHMFFKGSQRFPDPQQIDHTIKGLGGMLNASTAYDRTFYYFLVPSRALRPALELMIDAALNPLLEPTELRREIEVIIEESKRKRDNPAAMAAELLYAHAYDTHRIRRWRIGDDAVLRNMSRELALDFRSRLYRPSHLVVSIVGGMDLDQVLDQARDGFGAMEVGQARRELSPTEPPQTSLRCGQVDAPIQHAYLELGFKTCDADHPDREALGILASVLGSGRTSRLFQALKQRTGLVKSVGASAFSYEDVGMLTLSASLPPERLPAARSLLLEELERVRRFGILPSELELCQRRIEAGRLFQLEEVRGQAFSLAYHECYGDYRRGDHALARLRALHPEQVSEVAMRYLDIDRATLFQYVPARSGAAPPAVSSLLESVQNLQASELSEPQPLPHPRLPRVSNPSLPRRQRSGHKPPAGEIEVRTLENGISLVVAEDAQLPIVAMGVYFQGGRAWEAATHCGLARLALQGLRSGGTQRRSADAFQVALNRCGAQLSSGLRGEHFSFGLHLPSAHTGAGVALLSELLTQPRFEADRLERERESILADIHQVRDQGGRVASELLMRAIFGADHPLGAPASGLQGVVSALTREDVRSWHLQHLLRSRCLIVAAGDVHASRLEQLLLERLGSLPEGQRLTWPPPPPTLTGVIELTERLEKQQSSLAFGFPACSPLEPAYPPMLVLTAILSGLGGRLGAELRGRRSLAYSVDLSEAGFSRDNLLIARIACDGQKEQAARHGMLEVLDQVVRDGITGEELERARATLLGHWAIGVQTLFARVGRLAWSLLSGVGLPGLQRFEADLEKVSLEDVNRVASRCLTLSGYGLGIAHGQGGKEPPDSGPSTVGHVGLVNDEDL